MRVRALLVACMAWLASPAAPSALRADEVGTEVRTGIRATEIPPVFLESPTTGEELELAAFRAGIAAAVRENPGYSTATAVTGEVAGLLAERRAAQYPTVDVGADVSRRLWSDGVDDIDSRVRGSDSRRDLFATGRQLLYDGGTTFSRIDSASARLSASRYGTTATAAQLALQAIEARLDVVRSRALLDLAAAQVAIYDELLRQIEERFELGGGVVGEIAKAEANRAEALAWQASALRRLAAAESRYVEAFQTAPPETLALPPLPPLPESLDAALALSDSVNPELRRQLAEEAAAEQELDASRGEQYPRLSAELQGRQYDAFGGNNEYDVTGRFVFSFSLYDGGARSARVEQASQRVRAAQSDVAALRRKLDQRIRTAYSSLSALRAELPIRREALQANRRSLEIFDDEFQAGRRGFIDLLDVQQDFFRSAIALIEARVDADLSAYRLVYEAGTMADFFALNEE